MPTNTKAKDFHVLGVTPEEEAAIGLEAARLGRTRHWLARRAIKELAARILKREQRKKEKS